MIINVYKYRVLQEKIKIISILINDRNNNKLLTTYS